MACRATVLKKGTSPLTMQYLLGITLNSVVTLLTLENTPITYFVAIGTSVQSYPSSTFVTASFISVLSPSPGVPVVPINDALSLLIAAAAAAATLAAALAVIVTTGRELEVASEHGLALSKCCCVDSISVVSSGGSYREVFIGALETAGKLTVLDGGTFRQALGESTYRVDTKITLCFFVA